MRLFFHALILLPLLSACSKTLGRHPAQHVTSALTPMNHEVLDWAESTVCSTYFFNLRFRADRAKDGATGARVGIVSPGSVLGGQAPDVDSADALYGALVQFDDASFILNPRYEVDTSGFILIGTRPVFGRRCATVSTRGVRVFNSVPAADAPITNAPSPIATTAPAHSPASASAAPPAHTSAPSKKRHPTLDATSIFSDESFWLTCSDGRTKRYKENATLYLASPEECVFRQGGHYATIRIEPGGAMHCSKSGKKSVSCSASESR